MVQKALRIVCFGILVLMLGIPSFAQNTKGDKPAGSNRETRFKTPKKSSQKRKPGRRIKQGGDKASNRASIPPRSQARSGDRPGRPIRPIFTKSRPRDTQKAWRGDISGRRIWSRPSNRSARNVYPQPPIRSSSSQLKRNARANANINSYRRFQRTPQPDRQNVQRRRVMPWSGSGSQSGRVSKVYSQKSIYVNNKSQRPISFQTKANKSALARLQRYPGTDKPPVNRRKVVPRSASSAYIARRSTNTWANFPRPKRRQERAVTTDLAGKQLRTKNFMTQRPVIANPTLNYRQRKAISERPYKGPAAGGHISRTKSSERAWSGDVSGRAIRGGKLPKRDKRAGANPVPPLRPGIGANRLGKYQGNIKSRRGFGNQGEEYTGNIKTRRPLKGGGSASGKLWNNKGIPVQVKAPGRGGDRMGSYQGNIKAGQRGFGNQGEEYTGNIKTGRPLKGGGSRSGKLWNNNNTPVQVRVPDGGSNRIASYQGNMRAGRRGFNNQGEEYSGNIKRNRTGGFTNQGEEYSGNIKTGRPLKGGGSRSGKLWNNNNTPVQVRVPDGGSNRIASYQGNIKAGRRGFSNQGEEYSGNIKTSRPLKGGGSVSGKLWNNNELPIVGRDLSSQARKVGGYSGNIRTSRPLKGGGSISGKLWNNDESPILGRPPKNDQGEEYSGNIKLSGRNYGKSPKSADASMRGLKPSQSSVKAGEFSRGMRRTWDYIKNPSSSDEAQDVREPGKAFGRSTDFQGNIKMKKFDLFNKRELHPDAKFVKLNKNNVDEERDMLTNFKLWWARLFRKSETQPDHLKEKGRKPRYDKGESGLWNE